MNRQFYFYLIKTS